MDLLRIDRVVPATTAEGPGLRTAVWVQGCSIRCHGCFNPHLWTAEGGVPTSARALVGVALASGAEGITLLGGEPFEQAPAAAAFAAAARAEGLSVMTFTGHVLEHLHDAAQHGEPGVEDLLEQTDLLVDGPFLAGSLDTARPWVGSTNQRFHALTDRYAALVTRLEELPDRLEVTVSADGTVAVNGWADLDALHALLDGSGLRRAPRTRTPTSTPTSTPEDHHDDDEAR